MIFLAAWYLQDLMQVVLGTAFLSPELFFLALNFQGARRDELPLGWYLIPFLGGLAFDLRWVGLPGFSALLYLIGHLVFRIFWSGLPRDGRNGGLFTLANGLLCAVLSWLRLALWQNGAGLGNPVAVFLFQMVLTLPVLIVAWFYRGWNDEATGF